VNFPGRTPEQGKAREFNTQAQWKKPLTQVFLIRNGELVPQEPVWEDIDD